MILPDGRHARYLAYRFPVKPDEDEKPIATANVTVVVGRDTFDLEHTLERIGGLFTLAGALATLTIVLVTVLIINRGLAPIRRLSVQIASIDIQHLATRLDPRGLPSELTPIVSRLNDLLQRLQGAFDRERSFTADAAHELRTPLAGLESALEVCASRRREPEAYQSVVKQCLGVVRSMNGMVEGLLLLARADARQVPRVIEEVSVDELLNDAWRDFEQTAENRGLHVEWKTAADLTLETDRAKLKHIVSNLLDNAVQYADQGGHVRIESDRQNAQARIRISNTGSTVASADADKVFERFWRGDQSRTATGTHCGLGLAVCSRLIQVLGGTIAARSEIGGEFSVEVRLPALIAAGTTLPAIVSTEPQSD
jgi:heavy metal sensor kinase